MKPLASEYAEYIANESFKNLPESVILQAKKSILDTIGAALTSHGDESCQILIQFIAGLRGSQEATIFTKKRIKVPAINAALANGFCANALEMDDGHRFGVVHPGAVVVPSAIAAAEMIQTDGKNLLQGIVVGYEVMLRIAKVSGPSMMKRGLAPTGIVTPFGAAAAAGKILNLNREEITHGLALAGTQGGGVLELVKEGFITKSLNPAKAAMAGLFSALLAEKGLTGPETILEGENGFFRALMSDEIESKDLTAGLGGDYEICRTYTKFYASCRHTHAAIDCTLEIVRKYQIKSEQIDDITVGTYPTAVDFGARRVHPGSITDSKFSIPFCVALAIIKGNVSVEVFTEDNLRDEDLIQLSSRVKVYEEKRWTNVFPGKRGATVEIRMLDGRILREEVELAKGEPESPATWDEISQKFRSNSARYLENHNSKKLEYLVLNIEEHTVDEITAILRR
jgi:2-methylcitrate dehydratase PrpD